MAVERETVGEQLAWLEVDGQWLAGLWGLKATGEVKIALGKVHVGVRASGVRRGEVLVGEVGHAILPTRVRPKMPGEGERDLSVRPVDT